MPIPKIRRGSRIPITSNRVTVQQVESFISSKFNVRPGEISTTEFQKAMELVQQIESSSNSRNLRNAALNAFNSANGPRDLWDGFQYELDWEFSCSCNPHYGWSWGCACVIAIIVVCLL